MQRMTRRITSIAWACVLAALLTMAGTQAGRADGHRVSDRGLHGGTAEDTLLGGLRHHQGRSFTGRRGEFMDRPFVRRESQAEALREDAAAPRCQSVRTVELDDGRRALIARRVCTDSFGTLHVSPGTSHVIKYLDE